MRYAIVIEKVENNYSAYVPDLPGCIAAGSSTEEVEQLIREAIVFHLEGLREDGISPPHPQSQVEYVEIAANLRINLTPCPSAPYSVRKVLGGHGSGYADVRLHQQ